MTEEKKRKIASIKSKLKNESIQSGKDYGLVFRNYLMQDVLDKISLSNYAENFILKGGYLLFLLYEKNYPRATYDLDFSGQQISNSREDLLDVFLEILSNINNNSPIYYDLESLKGEIINIEKEYTGIRISINAFLDRSRETLSLDISFGDIIIDGANTLFLEDSLNDKFSKFFVYPIESVIAEKLEAIVALGEDNYRLKDFYDLYYILEEFEFSQDKLKRAVYQTFKNRNTALEFSIFENENFIFSKTTQYKWDSMKKRGKFKEDNLSFLECIEIIRENILPLFKD